jgi:hypothetical protein
MNGKWIKPTSWQADQRLSVPRMVGMAIHREETARRCCRVVMPGGLSGICASAAACEDFTGDGTAWSWKRAMGVLGKPPRGTGPGVHGGLGVRWC